MYIGLRMYEPDLFACHPDCEVWLLQFFCMSIMLFVEPVSYTHLTLPTILRV